MWKGCLPQDFVITPKALWIQRHTVVPQKISPSRLMQTTCHWEPREVIVWVTTWSLPGPRMLRRLRETQCPPFEISSDEEPLTRGIARRNAEPGATQIESSLATVPASHTALHEAGNQVSPDRVFQCTCWVHLRKIWSELIIKGPRPFRSSQFALPVQNRFAVLDATDGRVATVAEPSFRRLRLVSQGARVSQASGRMRVVDESMQNASVPGSDSVGTHPHEELKKCSLQESLTIIEGGGKFPVRVQTLDLRSITI